MTDERIDQLERIGFVWNPLDEMWNRRFDELCKYKEKYNTTDVPVKEKTGLGVW